MNELKKSIHDNANGLDYTCLLYTSRSEIRLQGTYRIYRRGKAKFGIADV